MVICNGWIDGGLLSWIESRKHLAGMVEEWIEELEMLQESSRVKSHAGQEFPAKQRTEEREQLQQ